MIIPKEKLKFSEREMEILSLVKDGLSSREISKTLVLSEDTVESYRRSMIRKAGARNMVMVVYAAQNCGLI